MGTASYHCPPLRYRQTKLPMFSFFKKAADTANPTAPAELSWRERLKAGLARTRAQFDGKLKAIFSRGKVDDELLGVRVSATRRARQS